MSLPGRSSPGRAGTRSRARRRSRRARLLKRRPPCRASSPTLPSARSRARAACSAVLRRSLSPPTALSMASRRERAMGRGRRSCCCARWSLSPDLRSAASCRSRSRRSRRASRPAPAPAPARASSLLLRCRLHLPRHPIIAPQSRAPLRGKGEEADQYAGLGAFADSELSTLSLLTCASLWVCCVRASRGGAWRCPASREDEAAGVLAACTCGVLVAGAAGGVEEGGAEALAALAGARALRGATVVAGWRESEVDVMRSEVLGECSAEEPPQAASAGAQSAAAANVTDMRLICLLVDPTHSRARRQSAYQPPRRAQGGAASLSRPPACPPRSAGAALPPATRIVIRSQKESPCKRTIRAARSIPQARSQPRARRSRLPRPRRERRPLGGAGAHAG